MAGAADADADDAADTLPNEDSSGNSVDDEAAADTDPAEDAEAGLEDEPEPDAGPVAPPSRRRSRRDAGEDRAVA